MSMNGATALMETLADCGLRLCIANPGTSEMHLVQALDAVPRVRPVLALFEGVATGAADGYGRMTGTPAATLLHLGPGLANGIANLHNARRANSPLLNLVGNHPHYHLGADAPLTSDIDSLARSVSCWSKSCSTAASLPQDGADAYSAALRQGGGDGSGIASAGRIATLSIGADAAWGDCAGPVRPNPPPRRPRVAESAVEEAAAMFGGRGGGGKGSDTKDSAKDGAKIALLLEHQGTEAPALEAAGRIAAASGCRLLTSTFPGRIDGGPGRVKVERLPYFPEQVLETLKGTACIILVGGQAPASFFAYQDMPSLLLPKGCRIRRLATVEEDAADALERLAERLGAAGRDFTPFPLEEVAEPDGALDNRGIIQSVAATLPEGAIVCTDSGGGNSAYPFCQSRVQNSWLSLTGGAIGQGGPCATGAALACPERPVLVLAGDGGSAYTLQSLWTQAREGLNVTTVVFANHIYNILHAEYRRIGVERPGEAAAALFNLDNPRLDWLQIAAGFGVPSVRAEDASALCKALRRGFSEPGPLLIEACGQMQR